MENKHDDEKVHVSERRTSRHRETSESPGAVYPPFKALVNTYKLCIFYSGEEEGTKAKLDQALNKVLAGIGCSKMLVDLNTRPDADEIRKSLERFPTNPQEFYIYLNGKFLGDLEWLEHLRAEGVAEKLLRDQRRPGERRQSQFSRPVIDTEYDDGKVSAEAALHQAERQQWDPSKAASTRIESITESYKLCIFYHGEESTKEKLDRILKKVLAGIDCSPRLVDLKGRPDENDMVRSMSAYVNDFQEFYVFIDGMFLGDIDQLELLHANGKLPNLLRGDIPASERKKPPFQELSPENKLSRATGHM